MAEAESWERLPGESSQAFSAFLIYLELGEERTTQKVSQKLDKSGTLIRRWSARWRWVERARLYDNHLTRIKQGATEKIAKEMRERQVKIALLMQQKTIQLLVNLQPEELTPLQALRLFEVGVKLERAARYELLRMDMGQIESVEQVETTPTKGDESLARYVLKDEEAIKLARQLLERQESVKNHA